MTHLSRGEYTQFSLKGRLNLLCEFGTLLTEKKTDDIVTRIYYIYDFYVEVLSNKKQVTKVEPIIFYGLLKYYF
jgi:hypothetical protein